MAASRSPTSTVSVSKNALVETAKPSCFSPARRMAGEPVRAARDARETLRTVVHGVHPGHDREQHLRGADVGRGLLAADVLLAGLECQAQRRVALRVHRDAHEAPRHASA